MSKIHIAIVDDHQLFLDGISSMLKTETSFEVVGTALTGKEGLELVGGTDVDVLLLDISLPDTTGIEICKTLHNSHPAVKIIALTMHKEAGFITEMLESGASGYMLKNASKAELVTGIKDVFAGGSHISEGVKDQLLNSLMDKQPNKRKEIPAISKREKEILQLIVQEHTAQEIADKLFITLSTVESHRANLLAKLNVRNTAGLVRVAIENHLLED